MRLVPDACYRSGVDQQGGAEESCSKKEVCGCLSSFRQPGRHSSPTALRRTSGVSAYAKGDAVRLLRAIDVEQAHGQVGASVFAFAAARSAGLRPGTGRYEEGVWDLVWGGGLTVGEHVPTEGA